MSFEQLGVERWLSKQCESIGITTPTAVQSECIPKILAGHHVVGGSATGSGKTAAFALPILQLVAAELYGVFALVITPSRELAYQIIDQFVALGAPLGVRTAVVIGGVEHPKQLDALIARPHVVVATPGRLRFLLETFEEARHPFRNLRFLVLDEADRLTEGDIAADVVLCAAALGPPKPFRRTLLLTATTNARLLDPSLGHLAPFGIPPDGTISKCCCSNVESNGASLYQVAPNLREQYIFVPEMVKLPYLVSLLTARDSSQSSIVFCNSCFRTEVVRLSLQLLGFPVASLNALLTQQHRLNSLALFKSGIAKVLIATDIASRGLDIPMVDLVVHYDFPKLSTCYVHRVGRTARAGKEGLSVAIVTQHDVSLVHKVERRTKSKMSLFSHRSVSEQAVMKLLDEVSAAKVQAKLQVEEQFGNRVENLKQVAADRRPLLNKIIRNDGKLEKPQRSDKKARKE